ncbi:beat protein [Holotrichia oblita]|uniref:Beat protein n=1 Tax=Holotrichia oblita TaxID=644536 RepID=A0ACB9TQM5_HOLOL|nr:beat protein [Holotrichia oblita]
MSFLTISFGLGTTEYLTGTWPLKFPPPFTLPTEVKELTISIALDALIFACELDSHVCKVNTSALRDMYIKVPEAVRIGDTVTLSCDYDLEQVALYTIKWYRYDEEFYRYVPKESPPSRVFPMEHITVDLLETVILPERNISELSERATSPHERY